VIDGLDPRVRRLVTLLQEHGFTVAGVGGGVEAIEDARRLVDVLAAAGVSCDQIPQLQATWSPLDGIAMVLLLGVTDADLRGAP
jgi:hypothetical protein